MAGATQLAERMTEDDLEDAVRAIVADFGRLGHPVLGYHPWKRHAMRAAAGYPDWTFAGPGGVLWRELKTMKGRPSADQTQWLEVLRSAGADAKVWRPADLISGLIVHELALIAGTYGHNQEYMRGADGQ
jgi:hypothetical protein